MAKIEQTREEELQEAYDMDKDCNLLSWDIPQLNLTLKIGDRFIDKDGTEKTLNKMDYADDDLGIYAMYPHLDDGFYPLSIFVELIKEGKIIKL